MALIINTFFLVSFLISPIVSEYGFSQSARLLDLETFIEAQERQEEQSPAVLSSVPSSDPSSDPSASPSSIDDLSEAPSDSSGIASEIASERMQASKRTRTWINWEQGAIFSWASLNDFSEAEQTQLFLYLTQFSKRLRVEERLKEKALENLMIGLLHLPLDSYRLLRDSIQENAQLKKLLEQTLHERVYEYPLREKGNKIRKILKYPLYGKVSLRELILKAEENQPKEFPIQLAQIQSTLQATQRTETSNSPRQSSIPFTAVIIDLRKGFFLHKEIHEEIDEIQQEAILINQSRLPHKIRYEPAKKRLYARGRISFEEKEELLRLFPNTPYYQEKIQSLYLRSQKIEGKVFYKPSLFPSIYNSEGHRIYSRFDGSGENFQYTRDPMIFYQVEKVGANPLFLFAEKLQGENLSDIIISKEASDKLFWKKETWNIIKKENRIFLLIP